jgi:hypothetical protein
MSGTRAGLFQVTTEGCGDIADLRLVGQGVEKALAANIVDLVGGEVPIKRLELDLRRAFPDIRGFARQPHVHGHEDLCRFLA